MSTVLTSVADVTGPPSHSANQPEFPFGANVLSLQTHRELRRSKMVGESEALHVELRRDTRGLKLLLDLSAEAVSNHKLRGLVRAMMMRIKGALDSDGVCILLKRQKESDLDLYALDFRSKGSSFSERTVIPVVGTIANYVLTTRQLWARTRPCGKAVAYYVVEDGHGEERDHGLQQL